MKKRPHMQTPLREQSEFGSIERPSEAAAQKRVFENSGAHSADAFRMLAFGTPLRSGSLRGKLRQYVAVFAILAGFALTACEAPLVPDEIQSPAAYSRALAPAWTIGVSYKVGDVASYAGINYTCRIANTAIATWEPPNTPALWVPGGTAPSTSPSPSPSPSVAPSPSPSAVPSPSPSVAPSPSAAPSPTPSSNPNVSPWTIGVSYKIGDVVSYQGLLYTCRIANTAIATWEPPNVPALWLPGGTAPSPQPSTNPSPSPSTAPSPTPSTAPSPSPNPSPTPSPNTTLPKRIMSGYWHTWGAGPGGGVPFIKLRDVDSDWDVINVSFAEPVTPGSTDGHMKFVVSGLSAGYTDADFKTDIANLKAAGKKIVLSIGGYEGYFSLGSSTAVTTFVNEIKGFINTYGFSGIDIDLEQSSTQLNAGADPDFKNPVSPRIVNMISAIRQICDAYGSNFILSWAPETFYLQLGFQFYAGANGNVDARAGSYIPMIYALRDKTTYVQAQLYNSIQILAPDGQYYSMGNTASLVAMCKMLLTGFNVNGNASAVFPALRPDQVVIAVPASSSAAGSGQVTNAQLQQAYATLNATYPNLRGIMTWSINWDAFQNGNSFVDSNKAYLRTLP